jgi:hypothetical protein
VKERVGYGFVSYTTSYGCGIWAMDCIGGSGLEGTDVGDETEKILESVQDFMFRRWLKWTDDGLPDLQDSAKRRLDCERQKVFWLSPGFDYNLLRFLSSRWPISVKFGEIAEDLRR